MNNTLQSLDLWYLYLTCTAAAAAVWGIRLVEFLGVFVSVFDVLLACVWIVRIRGNKVGTQGGQLLAEALKINNSLLSLDLVRFGTLRHTKIES